MTAWALTTCLVGMSAGCLPFETSCDASVSYATTSDPWGEDTGCVNDGDETVAHELLNTETFMVVAGGGDDPISDSEWDAFTPDSPWTKNVRRNLLFTDSCFAQSPWAPADCEGDQCIDVVEVQGHTWIELSQILSVDCIPSGRACNPNEVGGGGLAFIVTRKCHALTFEGDVYFLSGPDGERAVMHAFGDEGAASMDVRLPDGWSLSSETLEEPLVVYPFGGEGECYYNIIRDELQQSYHQIAYGGHAYPAECR